MSVNLRDKLRAKTVGKSPKFRKEIVTYDGDEFEIRQPSQETRKELFEKAKTPDGKVDNFTALVWGVINQTYIPGTEEKVFEETDFDSLMARPAGGFIDSFGAVALSLLNVEDDMGEG